MPQDPDTNIEIYTAASLSGGTGSGLLVPLTLYVKRFFKEMTGKNPKGCALLAMPDVCEDLLTPEQQVKARANAYATIRELNAMHSAMHSAASSEDHTVNFRIGDAEDPCFGLLYDSQDPAFTTPAELPFSQIYLFKRAPCTNTVLVIAQIMAQAALSLTLDDLPSPTTSNGALFGAIEVTKTRYSEESIVSYISHKTLFDLLNEKILENLRRIDAAGGKTVLRCPIIPGYNLRPDHFSAIAAQANALKNVQEIHIEPYHPLGSGKCKNLGREYALEDVPFPESADADKWIAAIAAETNIPVKRA
jgi:hypothetical protein